MDYWYNNVGLIGRRKRTDAENTIASYAQRKLKVSLIYRNAYNCCMQLVTNGTRLLFHSS